MFDATTGCGLNVRKHGSVCSLSRLATTDISAEGVLDNVMALLSRYWDEFLLAGGSFAGFEERYKARGFISELWFSDFRVPLLRDYDAAGGAGGSDFIVMVRRRGTDYWE